MILKQSSPLGERLMCPSAPSGAVATKKTCCLLIKAALRWSMPVYTLPTCSVLTTRLLITKETLSLTERRPPSTPRYDGLDAATHSIMRCRRPIVRGASLLRREVKKGIRGVFGGGTPAPLPFQDRTNSEVARRFSAPARHPLRRGSAR